MTEWVLVPREPTPEMVAAYLQANDAYWKRVDDFGPPPVGIWRDGTPSGATAESYRAMIAAAPQAEPVAQWRPIESAPADVPLLLYCPQRHKTNPERVEATVYKNTRGGSCHAWATHWMPLPAAPLQPGESK